MKREFLIVLLMLVVSPSLRAQESFTYIFPAVVDGRAGDGAFFKSTLMVLPLFNLDSPMCSVRTYGLSVQLDNTAYASQFSLPIPAGGSLALRTPGVQPLSTGYATLTCNRYVYATLVYSYYAPNGAKLGEATAFSTEIESPEWRLIVDQRENAQLGLAIANNTDKERTYDIVLAANGMTRTGSLTVPARSSVSRFLNQLLSAPDNALGIVTIRSRDESDFSAIGLRFTGSVFTNVPAN